MNNVFIPFKRAGSSLIILIDVNKISYIKEVSSDSKKKIILEILLDNGTLVLVDETLNSIVNKMKRMRLFNV
nr:MAG TPA: hypothetical protein [Caudoviricetes sp.]